MRWDGENDFSDVGKIFKKKKKESFGTPISRTDISRNELERLSGCTMDERDGGAGRQRMIGFNDTGKYHYPEEVVCNPHPFA